MGLSIDTDELAFSGKSAANTCMCLSLLPPLYTIVVVVQ